MNMDKTGYYSRSRSRGRKKSNERKAEPSNSNLEEKECKGIGGKR